MRHPSLLVAFMLVVIGSEARAQPVATPAWDTGFEMGYPGEFLDYTEGYSASGQQNAGEGSTWTIITQGGGDGPVFSGEHAYKGWLHAESDENHRPYPMVHVDIPTPLVNSFMVYLDVDFDQLGGGDWIHVGTWANNEDWDVHTMSVVNGKLEMAHVEDAESIPDELPDFPIRQWVRLTVYIHYAPEGEGTVFVWQDGEPMLQGRYTVMDGQNLLRAHWGMYAPGNITSGAQYNDDVRIWTLSEPLTDFDNEPVSPYGAPSPNPTPEAGTGGSAGADAGTDPPANNSGSGGRASTAGQGGRAGGSSGMGGRSGSGGSTSSGGRAGASGSAAGSGGSTGGADDADAEDSGCSVAAGPGAGSSSGALSLLLAAIAVLSGRRRAFAADRR